MKTLQTNHSKHEDAGSGDERAIHINEWEKARGVLQFFDDKLHDLRKYGFSFITTLLTAQGFLLSSKLPGDVPVPTKFVMFCVTLILILALYIIDKNYTVVQRAAKTRALVLEKKLNIELSEIITDRYRIEHINRDVLIVYGSFMLSVLFLGCFSLGDEYKYSVILVLIAALATILAYRLSSVYKYKYSYSEDWTISPLECSVEGVVKITLNNLGDSVDDKCAKKLLGTKYIKGIKIPKPILFKKNDLLWEIISEESGEVIKRTANRDLDIYDSQTWLLKGKEFGKAGVYQLHPRGWPLPLHRKIVISDLI
jgi:hypothetical protein